MKIVHARLLADMLSTDARAVLLVYNNRAHATVSEEAVKEVIKYDLIRKTTNLISGKEVWVLTPAGRKVAACI